MTREKFIRLSAQLLTNTIEAAIRNALRNFEEDTGITPMRIEVRLNGPTEGRYELAGVALTFDGEMS